MAKGYWVTIVVSSRGRFSFRRAHKGALAGYRDVKSWSPDDASNLGYTLGIALIHANSKGGEVVMSRAYDTEGCPFGLECYPKAFNSATRKAAKALWHFFFCDG